MYLQRPQPLPDDRRLQSVDVPNELAVDLEADGVGVLLVAGIGDAAAGRGGSDPTL